VIVSREVAATTLPTLVYSLLELICCVTVTLYYMRARTHTHIGKTLLYTHTHKHTHTHFGKILLYAHTHTCARTHTHIGKSLLYTHTPARAHTHTFPAFPCFLTLPLCTLPSGQIYRNIDPPTTLPLLSQMRRRRSIICD